jgi:molybdopterin synthase sulfur carrier subunit
MKIMYFAWVRERVGRAEEEAEPPASVGTIADLIEWLRQRGPNYAHAFEAGPSIRAAIDRRHAKADASLAGAREVAFFPPMTGG